MNTLHKKERQREIYSDKMEQDCLSTSTQSGLWQEKHFIENKIEDIKTWVLQKLLKEREFTHNELKLRSKELIQECYMELAKKRADKNNITEAVLAIQKTGQNEDWVYVCRKEMQKMREEWLKEDMLKRAQENNKWRSEGEKRKEEERKRRDEQMALEQRLEEMEKKVCKMEKDMEREHAKQNDDMKEYKKRFEAEREKEREELRLYKEMMQRERIKEKLEMNEYESRIRIERDKEREIAEQFMETLTESQKALKKQQVLKEEEMKKMEEEWRKKQKWREQCFEEEEAEKLELKRAMGRMIRERNKEREQLKVYQQRDEMRTEEMEQLRREVDEKLGTQTETIEMEFTECKTILQKLERKITTEQQKGWTTLMMELQKETRNREENERKTNKLVRDVSLQYAEFEAKLITIVNEIAEAMQDIAACSGGRYNDLEFRVQEILKQDWRTSTNSKMHSSHGKKEKRNSWDFMRCFKK